MVSDLTRDGMYVTPMIDSLTEEGALKSRPMKKGEIVIAVSGNPGEPCILAIDACIHDGFVGLRDLDVKIAYPPYLYQYLKSIKETNKAQAVGAIYKNLNTDQIKSFQIPLPPLATQQKIAAILDAADAYRQLTKTLIAKYDQLAQSLFLDMFGDPVRNEKGWEKKALSEIGKIITGNTPPRDNQEYYGSFIEWIKTDNINTPNIFLTKAEECLSELGLSKARFAEPGAILTTCIAGSKSVIGNVAIANRKVSFNQQINAIQPKIGNYFFWYFQFITSKSYVQTFCTDGMKGIITKGKFETIEFINPPLRIQNQFAERIQLIEAQKQQAQSSLQKAEELFNSLLYRCFDSAQQPVTAP